MTVLYCLNISPGEHDGDGEVFDEWFRSLKAAKARRKELIAEDPDLVGSRFGDDFEIERVQLLKLSPVQMALAILNKRPFAQRCDTVVVAYCPARKSEE